MAATNSTAASEDTAKDESFHRVAALAEELIEAHGKDFTMGTFLLAARFIAQDKPFSKGAVPEDLTQ